MIDRDIALVGTGLAPLAAASLLISHGKNPLILNPEWDFFTEDSELPLDPFHTDSEIHSQLHRVRESEPSQVLESLRPDFPGAVESWEPSPFSDKKKSFHDDLAPHVRSRSRLWVSSTVSLSAQQDPKKIWDELEAFYLEASEANLNPQELDGLAAAKRFPGFSGELRSETKGILIPKIADWDVNRYRFGLQEYLKERLGPEGMVTAASQIQFIPGGVRFYAQGKLRTERLPEGMIVFWTPSLTPWIEANLEIPQKPQGVRIWEEWSLISKETSEDQTIGVFEDMMVWSSFEGRNQAHSNPLRYLTVLRPGSLISLEDFRPFELNDHWISGKSFEDLSRLCHDFLNWEKLTIRKVRPRAIFDWGSGEEFSSSDWIVKDRKLTTRVVIPSDGPMNQIVKAARAVVGAVI